MVCYFNPALLFTLLILLVKLGACKNGCWESCGDVRIQFPFHLIKGKQDQGGYPGFDLSCTKEHKTVLQLAEAKFLVRHIDYKSQEIRVYDTENCLPNQMLKLGNSLSSSPFQLTSSRRYNVSFFNCSSTLMPCPIRSVESGSSAVESDLISCTKVKDVLSVDQWSPVIIRYMDYIDLKWLKPNCSMCEAMGKKCKLKTNGTRGEIECFACKTKETPKSIIAAGVTVGSVLLLVLVIILVYIHRLKKMKGEDQARIQKFLLDYKALKPTRFSYADIKRISNNFKDKVGEGVHGAVFKGKLSNEILVAVKILNTTEGDGKEFINEVGTMGKIHHVNVVRLLGFCADGFHRALVYNLFPNGSLQNFISAPDNKDIFLGWEKLQQIALGIAKGIEYLHQGCDHQILHFDINPHNVLLDDHFTPKITDFGLAKLCPKNQSTISMTAARGTLGYIAPEVFSRNFGNVSSKSDIYSYGMLLLEMVGGRKNIDISSEENVQVLYPDWIHNLLEGGDIHIHVEDEEDIQIAKKLATVGLWCIQWNPVNRPSIKLVVQMLEGDLGKLTVPPNPSNSTTSTTSSLIASRRNFNPELEVIHERE